MAVEVDLGIAGGSKTVCDSEPRVPLIRGGALHTYVDFHRGVE
jgi:hypothetical protein